MSKFYGTVIGDGQKTNATRRGFRSIRAAVQSWEGSVITELTEEDGKLMLEVRYADCSTTSGDRQYKGTVEDFLRRLKGGTHESSEPAPDA